MENMTKKRTCCKKCLFYKDEIINKKWMWILFIIFFLIFFLIKAYIDDASQASFTKAVVSTVENICRGYITGFIFYVVSVFIPNTEKKLKALNCIDISIEQILRNLDSMISYLKEKNGILGDDYTDLAIAIAKCERIYVIENGEDRRVELNGEEVQFIERVKIDISNHVNHVMVYGNQIVPDEVLTALTLLNSFMNMATAVKFGDKIITSSEYVGRQCKMLYWSQSMLEQYRGTIKKYI